MSNKLNQVKIYDYNKSSRTWSATQSLLSREREHFAKGGIRLAYRAYNCGLVKNWSDYPMVLKLEDNVADRTRSLVERDVVMQFKCMDYAEAYNKNPRVPKKVSYVPCQIVEFLDGPDCGQFASIEKYLEGNYEKHSTANPLFQFALNDRNTPQAFSHFTWEHSGERELVVDVQGVGDVYTDPQIYTSEALKQDDYGRANFGTVGIVQFFRMHQCNDLCRALKLKPLNNAPKRPNTGTVPVKGTRMDQFRW